MRGRSFSLNPLEEECGFHQLCAEPPLLKEDISPDDEGWLYPGCDCKVDRIDLLNDHQGTDLFVTNIWEKVYPKDTTAAFGKKLDDISGLPSDDSEDSDYNLTNLDVEKNDSVAEANSDEFIFFSASKDLVEAPSKDDGILGLFFEDSKNDDFNPDDPIKDESIKIEVDNIMANSASQEEKAKVGKGKRNLLKNELSYLMQSMSPLVSSKRHVERLLVIAMQGAFFKFYFVLYLLSPKLAHRVVGYMEEEAIYSYTLYLNDIDRGEIENVPTPAIIIDYWRLPKGTIQKDVITVICADEAHHRDVNHFASPWEIYQA
ncbi:Ubiquinol oxidase 2, mitochondrial [Capsicum annuum]|uniref:Ubiquinol oxidase n=2 Tax=Capsicum annuum TaxID=4072 RepID=A0A2G2ZXU9_CAPAN|nr:Ubiquinol oxidase 2, mitochondrial [Capsicum annuum]PHT86810.1 Ubiquinol oxidase 2, mitochondrial [Capsicum annuum]